MSLHSSRIAREQFDVVRVRNIPLKFWRSSDDVSQQNVTKKKKTIDCSPGVVFFLSSGGIPFITVHVGTGPWTGLPFIPFIRPESNTVRDRQVRTVGECPQQVDIHLPNPIP